MIKQKKKLSPKNKNKISPPSSPEELILAIKKLTQALGVLSKKSTPQHSFFLGIFSGLGTIFGLTFVLTFIIYLLTRLSFVPVLGDIATQIVRIVQSNLTN
jgi:hypothetical protein